MDFANFMKEGHFEDIVIQMALREIDSEPLATALVDQDEEVREIIFRNMSKRAVVMIREDIRRLATAAPSSIQMGQELFAGLLARNEKLYRERGVEGIRKTPPPPEIDIGSREGIVGSFSALATFIRDAGLLPLLDIEKRTDNPLFATGLRMLVEGWDPLLMRSILEKYKASLLRAREIEYDLIIEGIDSLASKDNPVVLEERLKSLVAGL